jgi:23S rRNA pseudouridine2605 synthase
MDEKLQKVLANLGYASRREIERWITAGRITVNGQLAGLGDRVTEHDEIMVDGRRVHRKTEAQQTTRVLILNKPADTVCTRDDPEGRPTVFNLLPHIYRGRWIAVGRLDINSSGLLLFTNNGELANRLMHPSYELEREYAVRVLGEVSPETIKMLETGVELDDGPAKFVTICDAGGQGANHWYHVTLKEGRNREVRRLWEAVGHKVSRLHRIRYGPVQLPRSVKPGRHEELDASTTDLLLGLVGLPGENKDEAVSSKHRRGKQHKRRKSKNA